MTAFAQGTATLRVHIYLRCYTAGRGGCTIRPKGANPNKPLTSTCFCCCREAKQHNTHDLAVMVPSYGCVKNKHVYTSIRYSTARTEQLSAATIPKLGCPHLVEHGFRDKSCEPKCRRHANNKLRALQLHHRSKLATICF